MGEHVVGCGDVLVYEHHEVLIRSRSAARNVGLAVVAVVD